MNSENAKIAAKAAAVSGRAATNANRAWRFSVLESVIFQFRFLLGGQHNAACPIYIGQE